MSLFLGFASFSPNQDPSLQYSQFSPKSLIEGGITNTVQSPPETNTVAKPKKFFKSRNSVPDANALALSDSQSIGSPTYMGTPPSVANFYSNPAALQQQQHQYYQQQQQSVAPPEKTRRKKSAKSSESPKKSKPEKPPRPPKPPKPEKAPKIEKPVKPPKVTKKKGKVEKPFDTPKPTRVLSRTRKVVNYSEDQSRSPPRNAAAAKHEPSIESYGIANDTVTTSVQEAEIANNNFYNSAEQSQLEPSQSYNDDQQLPYPGDSPSKNAGPPIVLRISKVSEIFLSFSV